MKAQLQLSCDVGESELRLLGEETLAVGTYRR